MTDKTLLFGIGATKAGTTWLRDYLAGHPEVFIRARSELHYFSSLEFGENWRRAELTRKLAKLRSQRNKAEGDKRALLTQEIHAIRAWKQCFDGKTKDHAAYLKFLGEGAETASVLVDITPAYAKLNAASFTDMAQVVDRTKFIYLLRDPLARLWSNIRMNAKRLSRSGGDIETHAYGLTEKYLDGDYAKLSARSDYQKAITALTKSVPDENIMMVFFEHLFHSGTIGKITDFLGIGAHGAEVSQVLHRGASLEMDKDQARRAVRNLMPQYNFIETLFDGQLPDKWRASMAKLEVSEV